MDHTSLLKHYRLKNCLPRHVAIIMDGNGRWAQKRRLPRIAGHRAGAHSIREIVRFSGELGIEVLTLYAFSTENWRRPRHEVGFLMKLLRKYLRSEVPELLKNNVKFQTIGRLRDLPPEIRRELALARQQTSRCTGLTLALALSYSGRADLTDAFRAMGREIKSGRLSPSQITEEAIARRLSTAGFPEVDLLIRTSGEMRISNFLLWEMAYAEFHVTKTLWPDFRKKDLVAAIREFQGRERRFGGVMGVTGSLPT
jgi:undecaprenyl diphosphate synthase